MSKEFHVTSAESVLGGHPDKICDIVAASILDAAIESTPLSARLPRVAMEVSAKGSTSGATNGGRLLLFGEVTLDQGISLDYEQIARRTIENLGYIDPSSGFSYQLPRLDIDITQQSSDIDLGVSQKRIGAGDQGKMYGGAVVDGPEFMPLPISLAHALTDQLELMRHTELPFLRPDGKTQVVVRYNNKGTAVGIDHITVAASHDPLVDIEQVREEVKQRVIIPTLDKYNFGLHDNTIVIVNGAGPWTIYGPTADAGTTNRKIIVDTYGGYFHHGGGGLNGKDPTKVDLSGALAARYVAKALVANGLATKAEIEVVYTIGQPDPVGIHIDTFGTRRKGITQAQLEGKAKKALDLSVENIINGLSLWQPMYKNAAVGGFFGRSEFPWEQVPSL